MSTGDGPSPPAAGRPRFLVTNDDGIEAPGLAALVEALSSLGSCLVVAPRDHLSGCSHQATTGRPLELATLAADRHHLDGTPVDCTRLGLTQVDPHADWVISGINAGGNLGADVYLSGTVAAVREAALLGRPGIAISQYISRRGPLDWNRASRWTAQVVRQLLERPWRAGQFWNVNLPHGEHDELPPLVDCPLDPHPLPLVYELSDGRYHYRARYQDRLRAEGADVDVCFSGRVAITELRLSIAGTLG